MRRRSLLLALLSGLLLTGCDLLAEEEPLPFTWVQDGARMTYDFHPVADTSAGDSIRRDVYTLTLHWNDEERYFETHEERLRRLERLGLYTIGLGHLAVERREDGLYAAGIQCLREFPDDTSMMLRVPAEPEKLLKMPRPECGIDGFYMVVEPETTVTVPAGTFDTFIVQSRVSRAVYEEYWNEQEGLIKIAIYSRGKAVLRGYYALASTNF